MNPYCDHFDAIFDDSSDFFTGFAEGADVTAAEIVRALGYTPADVQAVEYFRAAVAIKADKTALDEVNSRLTESIMDISDPLKNVKKLFEFEIGGITAQGVHAYSPTRIRSKYFVWCKQGTEFHYPTAKVAIVQYSDMNGTIIEDAYWKKDYVLLRDCYVRLVIDGTSDIDGIWDSLTVKYISNNLVIDSKLLDDTTQKEMASNAYAIGLPVLDINDFEIGGITISSSGWTYDDTKVARARTKKNVTYHLIEGTIINIADGYTAYIGWKKENNYYSSNRWVTGAFEVTSEGDYVILVRFTTETVTGFFVEKTYDAISFSCKSNLVKLLAESDYIPEYWNGEINDTESKIVSNRLDSDGKIIEFCFLTDTHWTTNQKHSPYIAKKINEDTNIPLVIFGGDIINAHRNTLSEWADDINDFYKSWKGQNVFSTVGNHDTNGNSNTDLSTWATDSNMYNFMIRNAEWFGQIGDEKCSYIDNNNQKVRYIQFKYYLTGGYDAQTLAKVDSLILEIDSDWKVVIITHAFWQGASTGTELTIPSTSEELAQHFIALQEETNDKIICWLCGHTHRDTSKTYVNGIHKLLIINVSCDSTNQTSAWGGVDMVAGTTTEQCIEYVQVDTGSKTIKCTRCGAGSDRTFSY